MSNDQKKHVNDNPDRFSVSQSDLSTELYREMIKYLEARRKKIRDALCQRHTEEATQELRGQYKELNALAKNIEPKVRPTTQAQKLKIDKSLNHVGETP